MSYSKLGVRPGDPPAYRDDGPGIGRRHGYGASSGTALIGGVALIHATSPLPDTDPGARWYCKCGRDVRRSGAARHRAICS